MSSRALIVAVLIAALLGFGFAAAATYDFAAVGEAASQERAARSLPDRIAGLSRQANRLRLGWLCRPKYDPDSLSTLLTTCRRR